MKHTLLAFTILSIGFFSCNKEPKPLTKEEITHQIDSIATSKIRDADYRAKIDLERRIKIEVKVKVDSILNAQQRILKDTAQSKNAPAKQ